VCWWKLLRALLLAEVGALGVTPHAAARMAMVAMTVRLCGVEVVSHDFELPLKARPL
jgi:hypothetical protein